ncbi:hypothetical protein C8R43DRAFT_1001651 [Mycena crocata]|nr:hypothetical protein C8R43DRAFT_1001651 [Mycena crocata]
MGISIPTLRPNDATRTRLGHADLMSDPRARDTNSSRWGTRLPRSSHPSTRRADCGMRAHGPTWRKRRGTRASSAATRRCGAHGQLSRGHPRLHGKRARADVRRNGSGTMLAAASGLGARLGRDGRRVHVWVEANSSFVESRQRAWYSGRLSVGSAVDVRGFPSWHRRG